MSEELKPCPFCGGKAKFKIATSSSTSMQKGFRFNIACSKCRASFPKTYEVEHTLAENGDMIAITDEREMAVKAWNRRANDGKTD